MKPSSPHPAAAHVHALSPAQLGTPTNNRQIQDSAADPANTHRESSASLPLAAPSRSSDHGSSRPRHSAGGTHQLINGNERRSSEGLLVLHATRSPNLSTATAAQSSSSSHSFIPTDVLPTASNPRWASSPVVAGLVPPRAPFLDNSSSQSSSSSSFGVAESPIIPSPLVIRCSESSRRPARIYGDLSTSSVSTAIPPIYGSITPADLGKSTATRGASPSLATHLPSFIPAPPMADPALSPPPQFSSSFQSSPPAIHRTSDMRASLQPNDSPALNHRQFASLQPNDCSMPSSTGGHDFHAYGAGAAPPIDNQHVDLSLYLEDPIDQQSSLSSIATASPSQSSHASAPAANPTTGVHSNPAPPSPPPSCQASGHTSPQTLASSMTIDGRFILPSSNSALNPPTDAVSESTSTRFPALLTTPPSSSPMVHAGGQSGGHIPYGAGSTPTYQPISSVRSAAESGERMGGVKQDPKSAVFAAAPDFLNSADSSIAPPFTPPVGQPSQGQSPMSNDVPAGARYWVSPPVGSTARNASRSAAPIDSRQQQQQMHYFHPPSSSISVPLPLDRAHPSRSSSVATPTATSALSTATPPKSTDQTTSYLITPPQHPSESQSTFVPPSFTDPPWLRSTPGVEHAQAAPTSLSPALKTPNSKASALPALPSSIQLSDLPPLPPAFLLSTPAPAAETSRRKRSVSLSITASAAPSKRPRKNTLAPPPVPAPTDPSIPSSAAARDSGDDVVAPTASTSAPDDVTQTIVDAQVLAAAVESAKQAAAEHGLKEYPCSICGKSFSRVYNLKSHMKSHSSIKPFPCSFCPKSFARRQDKIRHERIHTKERPFRCTRCDASFSRHDALSRHEFTCSMAAAAAMGPEGDAAAKAYAARLKSRAGRRHSVFMANVAQAQAQAAQVAAMAVAMGLPPPPHVDHAAEGDGHRAEGNGGGGYQEVGQHEVGESDELHGAEDGSLDGRDEVDGVARLAGPEDAREQEQRLADGYAADGERVQVDAFEHRGESVAGTAKPPSHDQDQSGDGPIPTKPNAMRVSPVTSRDLANPIDFEMSVSVPLDMPATLAAAMSTLATVSQLQLDAHNQGYQDHDFNGMVDSLDRHMVLTQQQVQSSQQDHDEQHQPPPSHVTFDEYITSPMDSPQPVHVMSSALPPFPGSVHAVTPSPLVHGAAHSMYATSPPVDRSNFSPYHFPASSSGVSLGDPTGTMGFGGDLTSPIISPLLRHPNAAATPVINHSHFVNSAFMTSPPLPAPGGRMPAYTQFAYGGGMAGPDSLVSPIIIHQGRGSAYTPQHAGSVPGSIVSPACTPLLGYNGGHTHLTPLSQSIAPATDATAFLSPGRSGSDTSFSAAGMDGSGSDASSVSHYGMARVDAAGPGSGVEGGLDGGMAAAVAALGTAIGIDPSMCSPLVNQRTRGGV